MERSRLTCIELTTELLARILGLPADLKIVHVVQEGHTVATGELQIYVEDPSQPPWPEQRAVPQVRLRPLPAGWRATENGPTVFGEDHRDMSADRRIDGAMDPELQQIYRERQRAFTLGRGWHNFGDQTPEAWERPLRHVDAGGDSQ